MHHAFTRPVHSHKQSNKAILPKLPIRSKCITTGSETNGGKGGLPHFDDLNHNRDPYYHEFREVLLMIKILHEFRYQYPRNYGTMLCMGSPCPCQSLNFKRAVSSSSRKDNSLDAASSRTELGGWLRSAGTPRGVLLEP